MRNLACLLLVALLVLPASALARQRVVIHKAPPVVATQPAALPVAIIPPLALFYDLARRTDCRGDVLGMGGAGFEAQPQTGNFLIPAIYRSECQAQPRRR